MSVKTYNANTSVLEHFLEHFEAPWAFMQYSTFEGFQAKMLQNPGAQNPVPPPPRVVVSFEGGTTHDQDFSRRPFGNSQSFFRPRVPPRASRN